MGRVTTSDITGVKREVETHELSWRPAAYAVIIQDNKILLTKQYDDYHLPGGAVELGETLEEAVLREVYEETGVVAEVSHLATTRTAFFSYSGQGGHEIDHFQSLQFYFVCNFLHGELSIENLTEDEKLTGDTPEWLDLDKFDGIKHGGTVEWHSIVRGITG